MADIDFRIVTNVSEYVNNLKEAQTANQSLNDNFKAGEKAKQDQINQTVTSFNKQAQAVEGLAGKTATYKKLVDDLNGFKKKLVEIEKESEKFKNVWGKVPESMKKEEAKIKEFIVNIRRDMSTFWKENDKTSKKAGSSTELLTTKIRKLRDELSAMEMAGQRGTKAYNDLSIEAARLQDQMGDTQAQVKILASDTKNLDAALSLSQGIAGGFALAQGTMAIFGKESENLQRQLVKLQGGLNILNGLQQVANTLNKDSAAWVVLNAKAHQLYNVIVGQSTGALKAFRLALAATGIGLIIVAITLLVENWDKLTSAIFKSNNKLDDFNNKIKNIESSIYTLNSVIADNIQQRNDEIAILQAQGENEELIYKKRLENLNDEKRLLAEQISLTDENLKKQQYVVDMLVLTGDRKTEKYEEELQKLKDIGNDLDEQNRKYKSIDSQVKVLTITEDKRLQKLKDDESNKILEERRKELEKYIALLDELTKKESEANLEMLSPKDRIDEQERLQLEELEMFKKHIQSLGGLTREQYSKIETIKISIQEKAQKQRDALDKAELQQKEEKNAKVLQLQRQIQEEELELIGAGELEKLELKKKFLEQDLKNLANKYDYESLLIKESLRIQIEIIENEINELKNRKGKFSIWELFGLDPEKDKEQIDALNQSSQIIIDSIYEVLDAQINAAEKKAQLKDKEVKDLESQIEKEKQLNEQGVANNIDSLKKELALKKEERKRAIEEERKLKKQQLAIDTAMQTSKLVLAGVELFESQANKGIVGVVIAAALIASMFALVQSTRAKAKALEAETALAKGGYGDNTGIIEGKRHSQGGEKFLDHVTVEGGERWAVFNRNATQKFGDKLPEFVKAINKGEFPSFELNPKINRQMIVKVNTNNLHNELKSINKGISLLNDNLFMQGKEYFDGNKRIEKQGNRIRIIHGKN